MCFVCFTGGCEDLEKIGFVSGSRWGWRFRVGEEGGFRSGR